MKSIKWTGSKGNEFELRAEYKSYMVEEILYSDGYEIKTGKMVKVEDAKLEAYVDGKKVETSTNSGFWMIIDVTNTNIKRVWGITKIGMTAEQAEKVEAFLQAVISEGECKEAIEAEKEETEKAYDEEIKTAKETIAMAEAQKWIPTNKECKEWAKNYNNINNEGSEGYVPAMVTKEQYECAKLKLQ